MCQLKIHPQRQSQRQKHQNHQNLMVEDLNQKDLLAHAPLGAEHVHAREEVGESVDVAKDTSQIRVKVRSIILCTVMLQL